MISAWICSLNMDMLENALIFARVAAGMLKREATSWQHQARGGCKDFINACVETMECWSVNFILKVRRNCFGLQHWGDETWDIKEKLDRCAWLIYFHVEKKSLSFLSDALQITDGSWPNDQMYVICNMYLLLRKITCNQDQYGFRDPKSPSQKKHSWFLERTYGSFSHPQRSPCTKSQGPRFVEMRELFGFNKGSS